MEQQSGRRHSVAFSSSEFTRNYPSPKLHASLSTGGYFNFFWHFKLSDFFPLIFYFYFLEV
jgi:hypothetical protein